MPISHARFGLVLLLSLSLAACGGETPAGPRRQYAKATVSKTSSGFAPQSSLCEDFYNARAGEVTASIVPESIHLALGAGSCSAPAALIAEKDGYVQANAPEGDIYVRVTNRSDRNTPYTFTMSHWFGS